MLTMNKNTFNNRSGPPLLPFLSFLNDFKISSLVISTSTSENITWISLSKNLSWKYITSSSGWKKASSGLFIALKYSANLLADIDLAIPVLIFAASFKSFQYSFAFLYFESARRFVFALSNSSLNCRTSALNFVLALTISDITAHHFHMKLTLAGYFFCYSPRLWFQFIKYIWCLCCIMMYFRSHVLFQCLN